MRSNGKIAASILAAALLVQPLFVSAEPVFNDVHESDWYYGDVMTAAQMGLFEGDNGSFRPGQPLSRAMAAAVLFRVGAGAAVTGALYNPYKDVPDDAWYTDHVTWLTTNGIADGFEDGTFRPAAPVTREQLAAMLYKLARMRGLEGDNKGESEGFADSAKIHLYAKDAMDWAVSSGVIRGAGTFLNPGKPVTRAEAAAIFSRFALLKTE